MTGTATKHRTKCHTRCCMDLANLRTTLQRDIVSNLSPQPTSIWMLPWQTHPHSTTLRHIRPEAKALHYGRMVGHAHDSKTVWRIWDPEFQRVKAQSDDVSVLSRLVRPGSRRTETGRRSAVRPRAGRRRHRPSESGRGQMDRTAGD
jgi:hypothetical protein